MVDKVTQANKRIAAQSAKTSSGPVGAKMIEMLDVPSFARGLTPQILIDLAKSKNIITKEQQTDFKNRVGKDRTALAEFNEIVTKADEPRLAYKGQSPVQIEMLRAKSLTPPTRFNQPERIDILKSTHTYINEAAAMDAPKEVKEKTFLDSMRKKFGDFADNPVVRKIASRALMILGAFPTALDFIPMSLLEEGMGMMDQEVPEAAKGGMMNINDITKPLGYKEGGETGFLTEPPPGMEFKPMKTMEYRDFNQNGKEDRSEGLYLPKDFQPIKDNKGLKKIYRMPGASMDNLTDEQKKRIAQLLG